MEHHGTMKCIFCCFHMYLFAPGHSQGSTRSDMHDPFSRVSAPTWTLRCSYWIDGLKNTVGCLPNGVAQFSWIARSTYIMHYVTAKLWRPSGDTPTSKVSQCQRKYSFLHPLQKTHTHPSWCWRGTRPAVLLKGITQGFHVRQLIKPKQTCDVGFEHFHPWKAEWMPKSSMSQCQQFSMLYLHFLHI